MESGPWPVRVVSDGRDESQPFGRQHAYNRGMAEHPAAVWVFVEADMVVDHGQTATAVEWATEEPGLVIPFSTRNELDRHASVDVAAGADPETYPAEHTFKRSAGAVNVVSAETMALVGCWDERLTGHWWDDTAMEVAFGVATGNPTRFVEGPGFHLWHRMGFSPGRKGPEGDPRNFPRAEVDATERNRQRYEMYLRAETPEEIRALTSGEA